MRTSLLILFLLAVIRAGAQNPIPNPYFEEWDNYGNYEDPKNWGSNNYITSNFGLVPVEKDSIAQQGDWSAKLVTKDGSTHTIPGILCSGTFLESTLECDKGFICTEAYSFFNGYAMFNPADSTDDAGIIGAVYWKWNTNFHKRDTIGFCKDSLESSNGFKYFSIHFIPISEGIPDSAIITIASSVGVGHDPPAGSKLRIDNIEFSDFVGIPEVHSNPVSLYPNPADDRLTFQLPPTPEKLSVVIFDVMGSRMMNRTMVTNHCILNTTNFIDGIFFYEVKNESSRTIASGSFLVKH